MGDILKKFRFRNFRVYRDARNFSSGLKKFAGQKFPKTEVFNLLDQLCRALNSILLNIAEGSDRSTDKDFALFLNRSHTSLNEVVACLDIAKDEGYITEAENLMYLSKAADLGDQLTAFRRSLLKNPKR